MRRAASILLVLLADIVILAHAVVPHHHHNRAVAHFEESCCDEDARSLFCFSCEAESHHHHHGTNPEDCAIYETVAGAVIRSHRDNGLPDAPLSFDFLPPLFVVDAADILGAVPFVETPSESSTPYVASSGLEYYARALGLRAPPAC